MKPWMKERDLLVQQTLAFVQGVVASKPIRVASNDPAVATKSSFAAFFNTALSNTALSNTTLSDIASSDIESSDMALSVAASVHDEILRQPAEQQPVFSKQAVSKQILPQQMLTSLMSERSDILKRVAAFRAHQGRLLQERETYYETVQAKIRTVLGNEMTGPVLRSTDKTL